MIVFHLSLCTHTVFFLSASGLAVLFCPYLFDTNNTIREPLYRTVWYLSTAPPPLAGPIAFPANENPRYNDSAQERTPSHGTGNRTDNTEYTEVLHGGGWGGGEETQY